MDIASLSVAMAGTKLASAVNISVMKNTMDTVKRQGMEIVQMINESSIIPPESTVDFHA